VIILETDMNRTIDRVSGLDKATILLKSLGPETTAKVFEYLTDDEREILSAQIVALRPVNSVTRRSVIDEVTKHVREANRNREITSMPKGKPLEWMEDMNPAQIAEALIHERPQSAAMVLSLLSPQCSANILAELDDKTRNQIVMRLATMKPVSEKALLAVDEAMRSKFHGVEKTIEDTHSGVKSLSKIIGSAASQVRAGITSSHQESAVPSVIKSISKYTSPEQMLELSDAEMFEVLTRMRMDDLMAVLRVAGEDLKSKVLRNISPDSAKILRKGLNSTSTTTLRELEEANMRIVDTLNQWSESFSVPNRMAA